MAGKKKFCAVALMTVLVVVAAACGSSKSKPSASGGSSTTAKASGDRGNVNGQLVLGGLLPQSGDLSAIIKSLETPVKMAVTEINAAGGVNGKPVVLKEADDGTSADVASSSLDTLLTSDKVDAIVGPASSGTALGIIDKIKTNGVVECSGSNTSAELSVAGGAAGGYYFRTAPSDNLQGPALAQLILQDNKHKVAILTRNDAYGTGFGSSLSKALKDGGADVLVNAAYDPKGVDFKADVAKVAGKGADAIVVIGFNDDGGKIVKEMIAQNVGPKQVQIYTADGMQGSSFYKGIDPANPAVVQGIKGTAPSAAPAGVTSPFIAAFKATGIDSIFSSYYYDCTILIALAAQAAGSDDPAKIKDKMVDVSSGGTKCQTFKACSDLLKAGTDIDYDGASGPVDLTSTHEPNVGVYDVWAYDAKAAPTNIAGVAQIKINA
jgi:ABC-type branched-subunit amino acid transport system substrate-binding protein